MAQRKKLAADARKEAKKSLYFAKLNDVPTSPRKMRIEKALPNGGLRYSGGYPECP